MNTLLRHSTIRTLYATTFSIAFFLLSGAIILSSIHSIITGIIGDTGLMEIILNGINSGVIALALFELAMVIHKEYGTKEEDEEDDVILSIRRTLPRFIGTVCVALSLEGLIMIIKYSQLELAGNLYYPVAIITSTALLLLALGAFIRLTRP